MSCRLQRNNFIILTNPQTDLKTKIPKTHCPSNHETKVTQTVINTTSVLPVMRRMKLLSSIIINDRTAIAFSVKSYKIKVIKNSPRHTMRSKSIMLV